MLNEPASSSNGGDTQPRPHNPIKASDSPYDDPAYLPAQSAVNQVLDIHETRFLPEDDLKLRVNENMLLLPGESQIWVVFRGRLRFHSELAYEQLDAELAPHNLLPVFRNANEEDDADTDSPHTIYVVKGRVHPRTGGERLSLILFILTVLSVLLIGATMGIGNIESADLREQAMNNLFVNLWRGIPYAASILLILGGHELGHYFAARFHRTAASLPYFIPFPFSFFGTFGAAIRLREPMRNRKVLLDIGIAGPLAGLVFAIPILFIGLATADVTRIPFFHDTYMLEGNSIFYALAKRVVLGQFLPNKGVDIDLNQLTWAGWTGLFVTGLNLIPVGQLDGGHILYSWLGKRAQNFYYPLVGVLFLFAILVADELLLFGGLILLMGNRPAAPLDDITPLDNRRHNLAIAAIIIFVLVFVPNPITIIPQGTGHLPDGFISSSVLLVSLWLAWVTRR